MDKINISKSLIKSYLSCPYRVYCDKIAGIRGESSPAMEMGTKLHSVFEQFYTAGEKSMLADNINYFAEKLSEEEKEHYRNFIDFNRRKLKDVGMDFFLPISLEKEIIIPYSSKFNLKGFIDRVDFVNGRTIITDYKTGKWIGTPQDYEMEMEFYVELYLRDSNVQADASKIYFSKTDYFMDIPLSENYFSQIIDPVISEIEESFDNNDFPKNNDACRWCNYQKFCKEDNEPCFLKK